MIWYTHWGTYRGVNYMDEFDKKRIENAIWTLLQYQNEIKEMSTEIKLDRYEVASMFKTLHHVYGNVSK